MLSSPAFVLGTPATRREPRAITTARECTNGAPCLGVALRLASLLWAGIGSGGVPRPRLPALGRDRLGGSPRAPLTGSRPRPVEARVIMLLCALAALLYALTWLTVGPPGQ